MKNFLIFVGILLFTSSVFAQDNISINDDITLTSTGLNIWYLNQGDVSIGNLEIKNIGDFVGNTFTIKIPHEFPAIFVNIPEATLNTKIVPLSYSNDRKKLFFKATDTDMVLEGIQIRIYEEESISRDQLLLDVDGDDVYDAGDTNEMEIDDYDGRNESDTLIPEKVPNIIAQVVDNGIKISWEKPVDLDVRDIFVKRYRNGQYSELFWNQYDLEYIDTNLKEGDTLKYEIAARDVYYIGEITEITIENLQFQGDEVEENTQEDVIDEEENEVNSDEQTDDVEEPVIEKTPKTYTRSELYNLAATDSNVSNFLERLKIVRKRLDVLSFKDKIWYMRYIIQIKQQ